jgi:dTDP-4-dehydrorhamnose reductase
LRGKNFLLTIRRLAAERDEMSIVADQVGVPNWSRMLAEATARIVEGGLKQAAARAGLYHLSSTGQASWHEFACAIVGGNARVRVVPIPTSQYPTPARRPAYGVLATARFEATFGFALPSWRDALARCVASPTAPAAR